MTANDSEKNVAVLCDKQGITAQPMQAYLESQNITTAQWYEPLELDNLDAAVCQGRVGRVIIPELSNLLNGIWSGRITFDRWLSAEVCLEFMNPPDTDPAAVTRVIFESWQTWRHRQRCRQAIAGVILSMIIIVTVFLFVAFIR